MKFSICLAMLFSMHVMAMRIENTDDWKKPEILISLFDALITNKAQIYASKNVGSFQHYSNSEQQYTGSLDHIKKIIESMKEIASEGFLQHEWNELQDSVSRFSEIPDCLNQDDLLNIQIIRLSKILLSRKDSRISILSEDIIPLRELLDNQKNIIPNGKL